jgi:hypothetical protein
MILEEGNMKITSKQLGCYIMAKREFISENDNYNKSKFGITKDEYYKISHAISEEYGICGYGQLPDIKKINIRLDRI